MKKNVLILLTIFALPTILSAQWSQSLFNSSNQQLVETAVRDGIILVRQDFQLCDTLTNQKYGRNHELNFGTAYSIAVKVQDALSVSNEFVRPWEFDGNFIPYRNSQYRPIISKTSIRSLSDSTFMDFQYDIRNVRALKDSVVYFIDSLSHDKRGFIIDRIKGEKDGWLVWAVVNDSANVEKENISLVTYKLKMTLEEGLRKYTIEQPAISGHILGGIYVCPVVTSIGTIEFMFEGLIVSNDNVNWAFYAICDETDNINGIATSDNLSNELTPIVVAEQVVQRENRTVRNRMRNKKR